MAKETEDKTLDQQTLTRGVAAILNDSKKGFYLVAEIESNIVASLMITFEWSDWRNAMFWWVQSVYVVPEYRRRGLYSGLYRHAQALAKNAESQVCGFRLYVEQDNKKAQATYQKLGMRQSHYLMFETE